jgi:hypothetical protein
MAALARVAHQFHRVAIRESTGPPGAPGLAAESPSKSRISASFTQSMHSITYLNFGTVLQATLGFMITRRRGYGAVFDQLHPKSALQVSTRYQSLPRARPRWAYCLTYLLMLFDPWNQLHNADTSTCKANRA